MGDSYGDFEYMWAPASMGVVPISVGIHVVRYGYYID